jgi:hypothetical protein
LRNSIRFSTKSAFAEHHFFMNLPPKLKKKLTASALKRVIHKFRFYFNDYKAKISASQDFVMRFVTNLDYRLIDPGSTIIDFNNQVKELVLLSRG